MLVFDRGYLDVAWFARLTAAGVLFVTRLKGSTAYDVVQRARGPDARRRGRGG